MYTYLYIVLYSPAVIINDQLLCTICVRRIDLIVALPEQKPSGNRKCSGI